MFLLLFSIEKKNNTRISDIIYKHEINLRSMNENRFFVIENGVECSYILKFHYLFISNRWDMFYYKFEPNENKKNDENRKQHCILTVKCVR